jgi:hypothetical protein
MYVAVKIQFEYKNAGLVHAFVSTKSFRADHYRTSGDYFRAILEIIYIGYTFYTVYL